MTEKGRLRSILLVAAAAVAACGPAADERRLSIQELVDHPSDRSVARIRTRLSDPDRDVRATALSALVGLDVPDAGRLTRAALDDPDAFVRATAAKLLGELDEPMADRALAPLVTDDPDPLVRQRAAEALTRHGGAMAAEVLGRGLHDPAERVRLACLAGISRLDPQAARPELVRLLLEDDVWEIRAQAAEALGQSGDAAVVPDLETARADPNEFVRTAVTQALRALPPGGHAPASAPADAPPPPASTPPPAPRQP